MAKALSSVQATALIVASNLSGTDAKNLRVRAHVVLKTIEHPNFWNAEQLRDELDRKHAAASAAEKKHRAKGYVAQICDDDAACYRASASGSLGP